MAFINKYMTILSEILALDSIWIFLASIVIAIFISFKIYKKKSNVIAGFWGSLSFYILCEILLYFLKSKYLITMILSFAGTVFIGLSLGYLISFIIKKIFKKKKNTKKNGK